MLERERLLAVRALEDEQDALAASPQSALTATDRDRLLALGADLERAWHSPTACPQADYPHDREIVVRVEDDASSLVIRWQGGDHTPLRVPRNRIRPASLER